MGHSVGVKAKMASDLAGFCFEEDGSEDEYDAAGSDMVNDGNKFSKVASSCLSTTVHTLATDF